MRVSVDNEIRIHGITRELFKDIVLELTIPNPNYQNARKLGFWTGNISETLSIFRKEKDEIVIPFGCLRRYVFLRKDEYDFINNKIHVQQDNHNYGNTVELFDYQEEMVNKALERKNGVIVAGCGSGKTIAGLTIASKIQGNTLWITHTKDLLTQALKTAKKLFTLKDKDYGTITDGQISVGEVITFATIQTLSKIDLSKYKDNFDCIIVDECFPKGTKVSTFNGYKNIEDLKLGDCVLSYNHKSGILEYKRVKHLFKKIPHSIVEVRLANGDKIICTDNHPIYTNRGYVQAKELTENDYAIKNTAQNILRNQKIQGIKIQEQANIGALCEDGYVYNIEVEDNNNYFVNDYLVHNCHHLVGTPSAMTMFSKTMGQLSARYKIGLTATPKRADGLERTMYSILGELIHEVPKSAIQHRQVPIEVFYTKTDFLPDLDAVTNADGVLNYAVLINTLCEDKERNNKVVDVINSTQGSTLVLSERVSQCLLLKERIKDSVHISASTKPDSRANILKALNEDKIKVVFATYSLAKEGLDIPNLKNIVLASPIKEYNTIKQTVGRVIRIGKNKEKGNIYDFIDDFPYFYTMLNKRKKVYKDEGKI